MKLLLNKKQNLTILKKQRYEQDLKKIINFFININKYSNSSALNNNYFYFTIKKLKILKKN